MTYKGRATARRRRLILPLVASIAIGALEPPQAANARPSLAELQAAVCHLYALHMEPLPPGLISECLNGKLVFVSSAVYTGNLGGLAGADAECNALASAAGIPGTFKAWLSDTSTGPDTRFLQSAVAYRLLDQSLVADDWADLTDGVIENPIDLDEQGTHQTGEAWSNTDVDGSPKNALNLAADTCINWATDSFGGAVGDVASTNDLWTYKTSDRFCSESLRLYCFEQ